MKIKTYEIEVVRTTRVLVTLPETMSAEEFLEDWENQLWSLEDQGVDSIAEYAARMAVDHPSGEHDGIGKMNTSGYEKADYAAKPFQVVAIVKDDDTETEIVKQSDWREAAQQGKGEA